MSTIARIRNDVFHVNQAEFASIAKVAQATISRWETGACSPSLDAMQSIREEALARGLAWSDTWFFELVPVGNGLPAAATSDPSCACEQDAAATAGDHGNISGCCFRGREAAE